MRPQSGGGGGGATGGECATVYYRSPGIVYPAGGRIYPFAAVYGEPFNAWTDDSVFSFEAISDFSGSPVFCLTLLAAGTYAIYTTFDVFAADATVASARLGFNLDRGVGPSTFFQGRYGATHPDHWENAPGAVGVDELFMQQWVVVRPGSAAVHITPDVLLDGTGFARAGTMLNAVRLTSVDLANV